jgi:UDP-N-acetylglucosamine 2-epimerase
MRPNVRIRAQELLPDLGLALHAYLLVTVHRSANTDNAQAMQAIVQALDSIDMPIIFPVHPRTRAALKRYGLACKAHIHLIEPVGYLDMLVLEQYAHRILTDSGGVQKEAFFLGVPCVTLREETEWTETVDADWNTLVGTRWHDILQAIDKPRPEPLTKNPFGAGDAGKRIAQSWE